MNAPAAETEPALILPIIKPCPNNKPMQAAMKYILFTLNPLNFATRKPHPDTDLAPRLTAGLVYLGGFFLGFCECFTAPL